MTFDIRARDNIWSLDATWIVFPRRPSGATIRRQARDFGATHYAIVDRNPFLVGFFDFRDYKGTRKSVDPLAPVVAKKLGQRVYAEFEVEGGQFWVLATDVRGYLVPGSDQMVAIADREIFRKRFPEHGFSEERTVGRDDFETMIDGLNAASVALHEVSLRNFSFRLGTGLVGTMLLLAGLQFWRAHEARLAEEKRQADLRRLAARNAVHVHHEVTIPPSEWVEGCVSTAQGEPVFRGGWIQRAWTCKDKTLVIDWSRAGGTLLDAPPGDVDPTGNQVTQTLTLSFDAHRRAGPVSGGGMRRLVSSLQQLGVQPRINQNVATNAGAPLTADLSWDFPTDPRSPLWDTIEGLTVRVITHDPGASFSSATQPTSAPPYVMLATIAPPALQGNHP